MGYRSIIAIVIVGGFIPACIYAQDQGEIEPVEIEIIKEREVTVPRASRAFGEIPARPFEPIQPPLVYEFKRFAFTSPDYKAPLRPLKLKTAEQEETWSNLVAAGFGNLGSLYGEALISSKPSKDKHYGIHFLHNSSARGPVDKENSAMGTTGINVFAKKYGKRNYLAADIGYSDQRTYFYGYSSAGEVDRDTIKQTFDTFDARIMVGSQNISKFQYRLGGSFRLLGDNYSAGESEVILDTEVKMLLQNGNSGILNADYSVAAREDAGIEAKPRNLLRILAGYQLEPVDQLTLTLGSRVVLESDTLGGSKAVRIYPMISARYQLSPSVSVEAGVDGGMEKVNLQTLVRQNPWLEPGVFLNHTNKLYEFNAKLTVKTGHSSNLTLGGSTAMLKNYYYFVNAPDPSRFTVEYDAGKTGLTTAFGEFAWVPGRASRVSLRGEYYAYNTDQVAEAWHRPDYRIHASASHLFYEKVGVRLDFVGQGGMTALDPVSTGAVDLDAAFDVSVKADYHVSKKFVVFVKGINLLGKEYPLFLYYPSKGAQVMVGASVTL